jgi:hypothetical protein
MVGRADPYDYGRARMAEAPPASVPEPVGLNLGRKWETTRRWLMAATGLAETEPGLDRSFRIIECVLAIVYFWSGFQKLFPDVSPAEPLAGRTIETLTRHAVAPRTGVLLLGLFEAALAGMLWLFTGNRWVLGLVFVHLCATFIPFVLLPGQTFGRVPGSLSLAGQSIVANLVLLAAVWALAQYHGVWRRRRTRPD